MLRWLLAGVAVFFCTACPGFGDKTLEDLVGGGDEPVTYEGHVKDILARHCWSCHGVNRCCGAPYSFADFTSASSVAERIVQRASVEGTMPPGGGAVTDEEKLRLQQWLAAGTPEGMAVGDQGPAPDMAPPVDMAIPPDEGPPTDGDAPDMPPPAAPTWDEDIVPIVTMNCAFPGCHAQPASGGLDLTRYAGFQAGGVSGDLTGGDDPDQSYLIDRLRARRGFSVMPQGGPMLAEDLLQTFEAWIAAGSPEN